MAIEFYFVNKTNRKIIKNKIQPILKKILKKHKISYGSIGIIFMNNEEIQALNNKLLNHDYPTDVISIRYDQDEDHITRPKPRAVDKSKFIEAEIFIGVEIAKENAKIYKVSLTNEILRLCIHGTLHLVGYNDHTPEEKETMTYYEDYYLVLADKLAPDYVKKFK